MVCASQIFPRSAPEHLLVSGYGANWQSVNLVMAKLYTAYIDDAGTDPQQNVAIATALVIPASCIQKMQIEWDILRVREHFSCFHMSEFSSPTPNKKSEFVGWKRSDKDRVYRSVREIIKDYGAVTISFAVYKKDYDEVVPADMRANAGKHHYTWAVRHLVAGLEKWRLFYKVPGPFEFVFDYMLKSDERRKEIEDVMEQNEHIAAGVYSNYSFRCRERFPGLQCVDVLGWVSYQFALKVFCDKPLVPDAEIGWDDFEKFSDNHPSGQWRLAAALKRSELERWVKLEQEQGLSAPFFEQWKAKKLAQKTGV